MGTKQERKVKKKEAKIRTDSNSGNFRKRYGDESHHKEKQQKKERAKNNEHSKREQRNKRNKAN